MFVHHGPARSPRQNRILAGYLACVAGFVNSAGLLLIASPTSHVTGSVARLAADLAELDAHAAAASAAAMVVSFFIGSVIATAMLEGGRGGGRGYAAALSLEMSFLAAFASVAGWVTAAHPRVQDAAAMLLCVAMGIQNSLVTRLSGAVVRTTHLTGVVTDLGIETAAWLRWSFAGVRARLPGRDGVVAVPKPERRKATLLGTILVGFVVGASSGASAARHFGPLAMVVPTVAVALAAAYAYGSAHPEREG